MAGTGVCSSPERVDFSLLPAGAPISCEDASAPWVSLLLWAGCHIGLRGRALFEDGVYLRE